jgi:hypothetical protein
MKSRTKKLLCVFIIVAFGITLLTTINVDNAQHVNLSNKIVTSPSAYGGALGSSTIILGEKSVTIKAGSSQTVSYTVNLTSGTKWGTTIGANSINGFSVSFSKTCADPTYAGTATISVASSVNNGTYTLEFSATGDDPTSSSTSLTVTVIDHTSSSTPPPTSSSSKSFAKAYGSDIIGVSVLILFLIAAIVPFLVRKARIPSVAYAAFVITLGSSLYLLTEDPTLRNFGYLHWVLLIVFTVGILIAMLGFIFTKGNLKNIARMGLAYGSLFMAIAMLLDLALGLPFTSISSVGTAFGFNTLFGFNISSPTPVGISLAFSLLLIFTGLMFSEFFFISRRKNAGTTS